MVKPFKLQVKTLNLPVEINLYSKDTIESRLQIATVQI